MPELDSITIQGFKSIAEIKELEIRPLNVLIGANGSGKSNIIGAFAFLHAIREGRLRQETTRAGGASRILHYGPKVTRRVNFGLSFEDGVNRYFLSLEPTAEDGLVPAHEGYDYWDKVGYPNKSSGYTSYPKDPAGEAVLSHRETRSRVGWMRDRMARWRIYHFHDTGPSSPLKTTCDLNDNAFLRPDGSNLAAFLYLLRQKHAESYALIRATVRRVAPFFEDFQLEPQRLNEAKIRLEWRHEKSDAYFDAASLSDGTLRFLALATLFLQPETLRPPVILVDEPELGLHPFAITLLCALAKQAASTRAQVIFSTQSPILLDHFEPADVLVADRVDGATQVRRLEPAPLEEWLEEYSLGELWEKNELGGRPAPR